jgi:hypothetical protein
MSTPSGEPDGVEDTELDEVGAINIGSGSIDPRSFTPSAFSPKAEFYVAVLLLESSSDRADHAPLYEESFVLIKAESDEEAHEKATEHGKQQQTSYPNEHHEMITWKLKQVVEVKPLEDATFDDGTELFSRFFRNYAAYHNVEPLTDDD